MPSDPIREASLALIDSARATGLYIKSKDVPGTRYSIRTGESEVRLVQRERAYYKIKDPFAKLHLKKHPPEFVIFEHLVHNILFHECRLDFMGVASEMNEVRLVFRQSAVCSALTGDLMTDKSRRIWRGAGCVPRDVMRSQTALCS